jgi:hypothetical protein
MGYLGICCGVYALQVVVGLEHRQAMKRMRDTLFKVSSRARVVNKDTSDLLASLKVSDSRLDMSRVLDVEFAEDHENVRLSGLDELDSR